MREGEPIRATIGVANSIDTGGRATANETSRGLRIRKGISFGRIASLNILRSLTAASFIAAYGGFVAGQANLITNVGASVISGEENTASGFVASVTGGFGNTASGVFASVSGGGANTASGDQSSVLGGGTNIASGGGASVTGGAFNTASGSITVVLGGQNVTDNKDASIAPQPPFP